MEILILILIITIIVIGIIGVGREYNDRRRHKEHIKMLEKISWNTFNITRNTISLKPKKKHVNKRNGN